MAKGKRTAKSPSVKNKKDTNWMSSSAAKRQLTTYLKRAGELASTVNESRQIPARVIKEPFTV